MVKREQSCVVNTMVGWLLWWLKRDSFEWLLRCLKGTVLSGYYGG